MSLQQRVSEITAHLLWRHDAIQINTASPFRLASGNYTPLYVNCRLLLSYPSTADLMTSFFHLYCTELPLSPDCVAGGETGGIAFGAWVAQRLNKPFVYVRRRTKEYGTGCRVEGVPRGRILLVEDMVTDGGTKLGFIDAIREGGFEVSDCLVVLDRLQGAEEQLSGRGVSLKALTDLQTCLKIGAEIGAVSRQTTGEIQAYLADERDWHLQRGLAFAT